LNPVESGAIIPDMAAEIQPTQRIQELNQSLGNLRKALKVEQGYHNAGLAHGATSAPEISQEILRIERELKNESPKTP
jgi:hypothetical protein